MNMNSNHDEIDDGVRGRDAPAEIEAKLCGTLPKSVLDDAVSIFLRSAAAGRMEEAAWHVEGRYAAQIAKAVLNKAAKDPTAAAVVAALPEEMKVKIEDKAARIAEPSEKTDKAIKTANDERKNADVSDGQRKLLAAAKKAGFGPTFAKNGNWIGVGRRLPDGSAILLCDETGKLPSPESEQIQIRHVPKEVGASIWTEVIPALSLKPSKIEDLAARIKTAGERTDKHARNAFREMTANGYGRRISAPPNALADKNEMTLLAEGAERMAAYAKALKGVLPVEYAKAQAALAGTKDEIDRFDGHAPNKARTHILIGKMRDFLECAPPNLIRLGMRAEAGAVDALRGKLLGHLVENAHLANANAMKTLETAR